MRHITVHSVHTSTRSAARRRLTLATAAASVLLLATSGCGDDSSSSDAPAATIASAPSATDAQGGTATPPDVPTAAGGDGACRLITPDEAEGVLGMPVRDGDESTMDTQGYGSGYSCSYNTVDEASGPTAVRVTVLGSGYPRDEWEQASRAEDVTEVEGVGDLAFFNKYNGSMDVFVDGLWLQAQLVNTDEATLMSELSTICSRAIERI